MKFDLKRIFKQFDIEGNFIGASPLGNGHINDTFAIVTEKGDEVSRYVFQRINHEVFTDPLRLMENFSRVTSHQRSKLGNINDAYRRCLTLIPARDGESCHRDGDGNFWRCCVFVDKATTYEVVETPEQAYEVAKAFGQFQKDLVDLPGGRLHETIPDFHDTPKRFSNFRAALEKDSHNRAANIREEIEFALARESMAQVLQDLNAKGEIPERITHNDTKLNNLFIDDETGKGICVIDLDTVMPGLALYDFGDLVRTATSPAAEDERDLSKVEMQMHMYEALHSGYLSSAGDFLTPAEESHLAFAGKLMTFETGLRFLTDYLEGDHYFKIHRPDHNLDRCRTQFKLVDSIEENEAAMNRLTEDFWVRAC